MKTPNTAVKFIAIVIALAFTAIGPLGGSNTMAASPQPHLFTTGMFGLARGQTARINAVCLPPGPCHVGLAFFDHMGNVIMRSESRDLNAGQSTFFDLPYIEFFPTESIRVQLRAVGTFSSDIRGTGVLFTGEVFDDDTGKTTFTQVFEECAC